MVAVTRLTINNAQYWRLDSIFELSAVQDLNEIANLSAVISFQFDVMLVMYA